MLSPEAPYPLAGGGALRTASLLEYLAQRFDEVDLVTFREAGADDPAQALRAAGFRGGVTVVELPRHSKSTGARVWRNVARAVRGVPSLVDRFQGFDDQIEAALEGKNYDVAMIEHFWCAGYVDLLRRYTKAVWLDLHNVESVLQRRTALAEGLPASLLFERFAACYRELEAAAFRKFDGILVTSGVDRELVAAESGKATRVVVYPNAIPFWPSRAGGVDEHAIAFSANFAYAPNVAAVRWFASEVWPLVRTGLNGTLSWKLIGKNPDAVRRWTGGDGVVVTGPVDDAIAELAAVKLVVAPLLSGSGTRLKIIEAWAASRPVVATPVGAEGLDAKPGREVLIAESARTMANEITRLLGDTDERARIGEAGRRLYESRYTWDAGWRELDYSGGISMSFD